MNKSVKILIAVLALCVLLASACTVWLLYFRAPKLSTIYDRVVELVEASHEVNTVFFGAGLPAYAADSVYAEYSQMYYDFEQKGLYEHVTESSKFISVAQIKEAAEKVYSKAYLEDVLYPMAFTGYAIDNGIGGAQFAYARYYENETWIYQSTKAENYISGGMRVYDYSTMKIAYPSNSNACYVTMDTWLEDQPEQILKVQLRLVLQDGEWYLDSFTG
ncbi:MAG: hypothetical protein IJX28_04355 [Clostridia bacterium]|nr:hypothetical protein [Clostridia bacterium]